MNFGKRNVNSQKFDLNESYSFVNWDSNTSTNSVASINNNIVIVPPSANSQNLLNIKLPTTNSNLVMDDMKSSAKIAVVDGLDAVSRRYRTNNKMMLGSDIGDNKASIIPMNALGMITQNTVNGNNVIPVINTVEIASAVETAASTVVPTVAPSTNKLDVVKAEQLKKTIIESTQEHAVEPIIKTITELQVKTGSTDMKPSEIHEMATKIAEQIATNVETKIDNKPNSIASVSETKQHLEDSITTALSDKINISDADSQKTMNTIVSNVLTEVSKKTTPENVGAAVLLLKPELNSQVKQVSDNITTILEKNGNVNVNTEKGNVAIVSENDSKILQKINDTTNTELKTLINDGTKDLIKVEKETINVPNKDEVVYKINTESSNKVLNALKDNISTQISKTVVENFSSKLPEHFNQRMSPSYSTSANVSVYNERGNMLKMNNVMSNNLIELFEQAATNLINEPNKEVKEIVNAVSTAPSSSTANVVSATVNSQQVNSGEKIVSVEVCTDCDPTKKKELASSVANLMAGKMMSYSASDVAVGAKNGVNGTTVQIDAKVPMNVKDSDVAKSAVMTVGNTAHAMNRGGGETSFINIILFMLIVFCIYKIIKQ